MSEELESLRREDAAARALAQREFERPLVLEAGAGTGKTATLVARIVAWCLGTGWERAAEVSSSDEEVDEGRLAARVLGGVVAITFTEAAAAEMATRVLAPTHTGTEHGAYLPPLDPRGDGQGHTTHLTTADANGMFVALTQTLGPNMGSSVVTPGLGYLYASTLGGYLGRMEPGDRARSFISPVSRKRN